MSSEKKNVSVIRQRTLCIITDWFTTFIAFLGFNIFRFYYLKVGDDLDEIYFYLLSPKMVLEQIFIPLLFLLVYWISGYYNRPFERSRLNELLLTIYSQLFNALLFYLIALTNDQLYLRRENWLLIIILFGFLFLCTYIGRLIVTELMIRRLRRMDIRPRTVIIGLSNEAAKVAERLSDPKSKMKSHIVGVMPFGLEEQNPEDNALKGKKLIKDINELKTLCEAKKIDQIIIAPSDIKSSSNEILFLLYHLYPFEISIKINPDVLSIITPTIRLEDILGEPFIDLSSPQVSEFSKNVKRTLDVLVSSIGLIALSPIMATIALGVKISSPGKVIYSQERIGIHRKPFRILKFRSMIPEAEGDGVPKLSSDSDRRITKIGKWMRKYRLDELPQFWNVFKGDMSLVGPRPEREYFIDKIVRKAPWYTLVHQVRPGITSWGMVKYGYATDVDQMIERNHFDLIYLANMSLAVDIKIMIHTIKTVSSGAGK